MSLAPSPQHKMSFLHPGLTSLAAKPHVHRARSPAEKSSESQVCCKVCVPFLSTAGLQKCPTCTLLERIRKLQEKCTAQAAHIGKLEDAERAGTHRVQQVEQACAKRVQGLEERTKWMERQLHAAKRSVQDMEAMADQFEDIRDMLKMPHPPVIFPHGGAVLSANGEACEFQILDSRQNGWLHMCETTLYVTTDDSDPTEHNYAFQGTSPLKFSLYKPCRIKACAITSDHHRSSVTEEQVSLCESGGIGLLLEKKSKYAGVLVQKIQPGGSAWEQGSIEVGDECVMIDSTYIHGLELAQVAQRLIGPAGSNVRLHIRRLQAEVGHEVEFSVTLTRHRIRDYFRPRTTEGRHRVSPESLEGYRVVGTRGRGAAIGDIPMPVDSDSGDVVWHAREVSARAGIESPSESKELAKLSSTPQVQSRGDDDLLQEYILNNSYTKSIQDYSTPIVRQVPLEPEPEQCLSPRAIPTRQPKHQPAHELAVQWQGSLLLATGPSASPPLLDGYKPLRELPSPPPAPFPADPPRDVLQLPHGSDIYLHDLQVMTTDVPSATLSEALTEVKPDDVRGWSVAGSASEGCRSPFPPAFAKPDVAVAVSATQIAPAQKSAPLSPGRQNRERAHLAPFPGHRIQPLGGDSVQQRHWLSNTTISQPAFSPSKPSPYASPHFHQRTMREHASLYRAAPAPAWYLAHGAPSRPVSASSPDKASSSALI